MTSLPPPSLPSSLVSQFDLILTTNSSFPSDESSELIMKYNFLLNSIFEKTLYVSSSTRFCHDPTEVFNALKWSHITGVYESRNIVHLHSPLALNPNYIAFDRSFESGNVFVSMIHRLKENTSERIDESEVLKRVLEVDENVRVHTMISRFYMQVCLKDKSQCWVEGKVIAVGGEEWDGFREEKNRTSVEELCENVNRFVDQTRFIQPRKDHKENSKNAPNVLLLEQKGREFALIDQSLK